MDGTMSLVIANELMLYGVIDGSGFGDIRAIDVVDSLTKINGNSVSVRINSPGGSVTEALAIYNALRSDGRTINVQIDAMAASAASVIAMAGDEIVMHENASIMIHDPWTILAGSSEDFRKMADEIDRMRAIILDIYAKRTGKSVEEISAMMAEETYMSADQAVALGFADRVAAPLAIAAAAPLSREIMLRLLVGAEKSDASAPVPAAPAAFKQEATLADQVQAGVVPAESPTIVAAAPAVDIEAIRAEAARAERERVAKISAAVRNARLDPSFADALISEGVSLEQANAKIIDKFAEVNAAATGPEIQNVYVSRDETETRKQAMTEALALRLGAHGEPSAAARQYMDAGIVDMAAERTNYRGRLGVAANREHVLRMAFHTTSDFPEIMENAMNKSLVARYQMVAPTYRSIARQRVYNDFRDHIAVKAGDFPTLQEVTEGGEIKAGTVSDTKESTNVKAYGIQLGFSRQLLVNDNLMAIQQVLASRADAVANFEETTFYTMMLSNASAGPTLNETSRGVFNTTDKTKASSGGAIDITTLSTGRENMRKKTSLDGLKLNIFPSVLLVGPAYETLALQYTSSAYTPTQGSTINPFSGVLRVVVTPQITGNAWYLFADPNMGANFEWGLLDGYTAPRFRIEEPFGQQGMRVSLEHDFGCGAIDYRFGWLNAGA